MKKNLKTALALLLASLLLWSLPLTGLAAVKVGDVDFDGDVTAADARLALRRAVELETYEKGSDAYVACDADRDGEVTAADARLILRAAVGLQNLDIVVPPSPNGYDTLRSGKFTLDGSMTDKEGTKPMTMALDGKGGFYAAADFEGMKLGVLVRNGKLTLISDDKKCYVTPSNAELSTVGLSSADFSEMIGSMDFSGLPDLEKADGMSASVFNGVPCTVYSFRNEEGDELHVYMDGTTLLGIYNSYADGTYSILRINSLSPDFPNVPPKGYSNKLTLILFMLAVMPDLV